MSIWIKTEVCPNGGGYAMWVRRGDGWFRRGVVVALAGVLLSIVGAGSASAVTDPGRVGDVYLPYTITVTKLYEGAYRLNWPARSKYTRIFIECYSHVTGARCGPRFAHVDVEGSTVIVRGLHSYSPSTPAYFVAAPIASLGGFDSRTEPGPDTYWQSAGEYARSNDLSITNPGPQPTSVKFSPMHYTPTGCEFDTYYKGRYVAVSRYGLADGVWSQVPVSAVGNNLDDVAKITWGDNPEGEEPAPPYTLPDQPGYTLGTHPPHAKGSYSGCYLATRTAPTFTFTAEVTNLLMEHSTVESYTGTFTADAPARVAPPDATGVEVLGSTQLADGGLYTVQLDRPSVAQNPVTTVDAWCDDTAVTSRVVGTDGFPVVPGLVQFALHGPPGVLSHCTVGLGYRTGVAGDRPVRVTELFDVYVSVPADPDLGTPTIGDLITGPGSTAGTVRVRAHIANLDPKADHYGWTLVGEGQQWNTDEDGMYAPNPCASNIVRPGPAGIDINTDVALGKNPDGTFDTSPRQLWVAACSDTRRSAHDVVDPTTGASTAGQHYGPTVNMRIAEVSSVPFVPTPAVTPVVAPGRPTGVTVSAGDRRVTVGWRAPAEGGGSPITGYTATAAPGGRSCTTTALRCDIVGLTNGSLYTVTVKATNRAGTSLASIPPVPGTPKAAPVAPGPPRSGHVSGFPGRGQAVVVWAPPISSGGSPVNRYRVRVSPPNPKSATAFGGWVDSAIAARTLNGLTLGASYRVQVSAGNAAGWSTPTTFTFRQASVPSPVRSARVVGYPRAGQVTLSWAPPASTGGTALQYQVRVSAPNSATRFGPWTRGPGLTRTVAGLTRGSTYRLQIVAVNSQGGSTPVTVVARPTR